LLGLASLQLIGNLLLLGVESLRADILIVYVVFVLLGHFAHFVGNGLDLLQFLLVVSLLIHQQLVLSAQLQEMASLVIDRKVRIRKSFLKLSNLLLELCCLTFTGMNRFDLLPHQIGLLLPLNSFMFVLGQLVTVEVELGFQSTAIRDTQRIVTVFKRHLN